jgi:hypothetical protein
MKKLFILLLLAGSLSVSASNAEETSCKIIKHDSDSYRVLAHSEDTSTLKIKILDSKKKVINILEKRGSADYHFVVSFKEVPDAKFLVVEQVKQKEFEYTLK